MYKTVCTLAVILSAITALAAPPNQPESTSEEHTRAKRSNSLSCVQVNEPYKAPYTVCSPAAAAPAYGPAPALPISHSAPAEGYGSSYSQPIQYIAIPFPQAPHSPATYGHSAPLFEQHALASGGYAEPVSHSYSAPVTHSYGAAPATYAAPASHSYIAAPSHATYEAPIGHSYGPATATYAAPASHSYIAAPSHGAYETTIGHSYEAPIGHNYAAPNYAIPSPGYSAPASHGYGGAIGGYSAPSVSYGAVPASYAQPAHAYGSGIVKPHYRNSEMDLMTSDMADDQSAFEQQQGLEMARTSQIDYAPVPVIPNYLPSLPIAPAAHPAPPAPPQYGHASHPLPAAPVSGGYAESSGYESPSLGGVEAAASPSVGVFPNIGSKPCSVPLQVSCTPTIVRGHTLSPCGGYAGSYSSHPSPLYRPLPVAYRDSEDKSSKPGAEMSLEKKEAEKKPETKQNDSTKSTDVPSMPPK